MLEQIEIWDQQLFFFLNGLHQHWLDPIMYTISTKEFWIPAYLILIYLIWKNLGWKQTIWVLVCVAILITLSDQTASSVFKPFFQRLRPCRPENEFGETVHIVYQKCGGKYGFVSSHAANFFALATFMSFIFRERALRWIFFLSATLVAYSRIYLGVHYPGDVVGGAFIGVLSANITFIIYQLGKRLIPFIGTST